MKTIPLSGIIGSDVLASTFRRELDSAQGAAVRVEVNSPGGSVVEGLELHNILRNYSGGSTAHIMGLAASMASYVILGAGRVTGEANLVLMLHEVRGASVGTADDLRKSAEVFENLNDILAEAYAAKSGKPMAEVRALMKNETWYFGSEAVDAGFVDEITGTAAESKAQAFARARAAAASARAFTGAANQDVQQIAALLRAAPRAQANTETTFARFMREGLTPTQSALFEEARDEALRSMGRAIAASGAGEDCARYAENARRVEILDSLLERAPRLAGTAATPNEAIEIENLAGLIARGGKRN